MHKFGLLSDTHGCWDERLEALEARCRPSKIRCTNVQRTFCSLAQEPSWV